ncbi:MAG: ABC transporter substrate-binding protein [Taibaiella sp.]|nr:ABC transporter substrate-binding protein [Taibaiella sp.]
MMGRRVLLNGEPKRIVSLVPSQTELLHDLGLEEEVVGITKFCIHPESWFRSKRRVGGTKSVHLEIIDELKPDLVIANKEENTQEQVEALAEKYPVWISDIRTLDEALQMILSVGELTGREGKAADIVSNIRSGMASLQTAQPLRVAYYIWRNPWMSVGGDTFISDMISRIGWTNVLENESRYPVVNPESLRGTGVQRVLLSSEPYPFKEQHIGEIKQALPNVEVTLVDGEMFSWYGSRLMHAPGYFSGIV